MKKIYKKILRQYSVLSVGDEQNDDKKSVDAREKMLKFKATTMSFLYHVLNQEFISSYPVQSHKKKNSNPLVDCMKKSLKVW